jgi:serine/threonine-protein kinase
LQTPSDLGRYRLLARLAQGGMGDVYLALARGPSGFSKLAVVKELRPGLVQASEHLEMFLDEARLAARLNHANIVQTNEVGSDGNRHFLGMEHLEGQPLQRILHRLGKSQELTLAMRLRILCLALDGLHYAHEFVDLDGSPLHIVHRDVSPHNIFVTYDGQVKVVDFGIAKSRRSGETRPGVVKGKAAYMAPEQALGIAVDRRADIYSAGVVLWELLARRRMWEGVADLTILMKVVHEEAPALKEAAPETSDELVRICHRALARKAGDRYETALAFRNDLESCIGKLPAGATMAAVGRLVADSFSDERANLRAIIEGASRRATATGSASFRVVDLAPRSSEGPSSLFQTITASRMDGYAGFLSAIHRGPVPAPRPIGPLGLRDTLAPTTLAPAGLAGATLGLSAGAPSAGASASIASPLGPASEKTKRYGHRLSQGNEPATETPSFRSKVLGLGALILVAGGSFLATRTLMTRSPHSGAPFAWHEANEGDEARFSPSESSFTGLHGDPPSQGSPSLPGKEESSMGRSPLSRPPLPRDRGMVSGAATPSAMPSATPKVVVSVPGHAADGPTRNEASALESDARPASPRGPTPLGPASHPPAGHALASSASTFLPRPGSSLRERDESPRDESLRHEGASALPSDAVTPVVLPASGLPPAMTAAVVSRSTSSKGAVPFGPSMVRPKLLEGREPVYTREALLARVEGTLVAKCIITPAGTLSDCEILKSLPHMDKAVLEALATRRYSPVVVHGRPTAVEYVFNVELVPPP